MPNHFAAFIVRRKNRTTGVAEQLVLDSTPLDDPFLLDELEDETPKPASTRQTKYPGGRNDEYPEEKPLDTACRELFEETGLKVHNKKKVRLVRLILSTNHHKYWFLIDDFYCTGELKLSGKPDTRAMHSNLRYEPVNMLYDKLYRTHRQALLDSVQDPPISLPFD